MWIRQSSHYQSLNLLAAHEYFASSPPCTMSLRSLWHGKAILRVDRETIQHGFVGRKMPEHADWFRNGKDVWIQNIGPCSKSAVLIQKKKKSASEVFTKMMWGKHSKWCTMIAIKFPTCGRCMQGCKGDQTKIASKIGTKRGVWLWRFGGAQSWEVNEIWSCASSRRRHLWKSVWPRETTYGCWLDSAMSLLWLSQPTIFSHLVRRQPRVHGCFKISHL